jgi:outer membrane protein assembly factor BamA
MRTTLFPLLALCALSAAPLAAQKNPCTRFHPRVDDVQVRGAKNVSRAIIEPVLLVEKTPFWRRKFGWNYGPAQTCLDSADVARDVAIISGEYKARGYALVRVKGTVERFGDRQARVVYTITEGAPVRITEVTVAGLPAAAADSGALARYLLGQPFDDSVVAYVADSIQALIRDAGYARAAPRMLDTLSDTLKLTSRVGFVFTPRNLTFVDTVVVDTVDAAGRPPALGDRAIRGAFGIRSGEQYSATRISLGQRELSAFELYRQIKIDTIPARGGVGRDSIGLKISAVESDRMRARSTLGWGTLDCFRTQSRFVQQSLLGLGHRLELTGRLSKIGVAEPFSGLSGLCAARLRGDPFSQNLNYYGGATVRLRGLSPLGAPRWQPEVTLFSERKSQVGAYEQTTEIGLLGTSVHRLSRLLTVTGQYSYTDSRTAADRAVSCDRFGFCRLEDVASFVLRTPQNTLGSAIVYNPILPTDDPVNGYRWSADVKYGHANIGRLFPIDFGRFQLEGATYRPFGEALVVAVRAQFGGVIAQESRLPLLPPAERFYGGGQNSVRGFAQNQLGPGSYIVDQVDTVDGPGGSQTGVARAGVDPRRMAPSGGNAMWVANLEVRTRHGWPMEILRWVAFIDAGRVWNTRDVFSVTNASARITPGIGIRLITPLGPFRLDVGYNPYIGEPGPAFLIVNGDPEKGIVGRAICVSSGSTDPLTLRPGQVGGASSCPATFQPPAASGFAKRLTFHFSLGNAF